MNYHFKMYLSPNFFVLIYGRDTFERSIAPTFKEKSSSSNEIMFHKVKKEYPGLRELTRRIRDSCIVCRQGLWVLLGH